MTKQEEVWACLWAPSLCSIELNKAKSREAGPIEQLIPVEVQKSWLHQLKRFKGRQVQHKRQQNKRRRYRRTRSFSKVGWCMHIGRIKDRWQHQEWEQCWRSSPIWLQIWVTHMQRQAWIMWAATRTEIRVNECPIKAWWTHNWRNICHNIPLSGLKPTTRATKAQHRWWLTCASMVHLANSRNMRSQVIKRLRLVATILPARMEMCFVISTAWSSRWAFWRDQRIYYQNQEMTP